MLFFKWRFNERLNAAVVEREETKKTACFRKRKWHLCRRDRILQSTKRRRIGSDEMKRKTSANETAIRTDVTRRICQRSGSLDKIRRTSCRRCAAQLRTASWQRGAIERWPRRQHRWRAVNTFLNVRAYIPHTHTRTTIKAKSVIIRLKGERLNARRRPIDFGKKNRMDK